MFSDIERIAQYGKSLGVWLPKGGPKKTTPLKHVPHHPFSIMVCLATIMVVYKNASPQTCTATFVYYKSEKKCSFPRHRVLFDYIERKGVST